jgi:protein-S-isoprenylcysteine O-methyltransferase Ste14
MSRPGAVIISVCWWLATAGLGAVLVPWRLTGWHANRTTTWWPALAVSGTLLVAAGVLTTVAVFVAFVRADGTPMPGADTQHLVVTGLNRHVRNPIYLGALAIFTGETLILLRWNMLVFTLTAWAGAAAFVHFYEEPKLRRRFGATYEAYRAATSAWIPHFTRRKRTALPKTAPASKKRSNPGG